MPFQDKVRLSKDAGGPNCSPALILYLQNLLHGIIRYISSKYIMLPNHVIELVAVNCV
jgi:hypothetical protein